MPVTDISARIRAAAIAAIERQAPNEDIGFDLAPMVTPGELFPFRVVYHLVYSMPSPLPGCPPLGHVAEVPGLDIGHGAIENITAAALHDLRRTAAALTDRAAVPPQRPATP